MEDTSFCINLSGNNASNGTALRVFQCNNSTAQQWTYMEELIMLHRDPRFVIGFDSDAVRYRMLILKWLDSDDHSQHWTILSDGKIANKYYPKFCIGISGSAHTIKSSALLELHPCIWSNPLAWKWEINSGLANYSNKFL